MHYCLHYAVLAPQSNYLQVCLEQEYHIPCETVYNSDHTQVLLLSFDIAETHPKFAEITGMLSCILSDNQEISANKNVTLLYFPVYSEEERSAAKWLAIRNSFMKVYPENPTDLFGSACFEEKECACQYLSNPLSPCIIRSPIKWHKNHFASVVGNEYCIFCSELAREIMINNQAHGMQFSAVLKKASGQPIKDVFQLHSTFTVPNGGIIGIHGMEEHICERCGTRMLEISDPRYKYAIKADAIPEGIDFCQTLPIFLRPESHKNGYSKFLISQRLYRILRDNMLDRSFTFTPIDVIEESLPK